MLVFKSYTRIFLLIRCLIFVKYDVIFDVFTLAAVVSLGRVYRRCTKPSTDFTQTEFTSTEFTYTRLDASCVNARCVSFS